MKANAVHQFVPVFSSRDAVGNEVRVIREFLRSCGYTSEIFCEAIHPKKSSDSKTFTEYHVNPEDIIIYHHAGGTNLVDFLMTLPNKLIMIYHNITPHDYFVGTSGQGVINSLVRGREQLRELKQRVGIALCHSEFSRQELVEAGFKNTAVLPVIIDFQGYKTKPNDKIFSKYSDSTNILFVGRLAPNKKIEDLLKVFASYSKYINRKSRLFLLGKGCGRRYFSFLLDTVEMLQLENVHFILDADTQRLVTYYKLADVFVCMSEHEGFCVPLVESMYFGVPIIAYNCTAVPDTLGGSGILVNEKNYDEIAELIQLIVEDENLRNKIVRKQYERLDTFDRKVSEKILHEHIVGIIS